jgi:hypothetical protein
MSNAIIRISKNRIMVQDNPRSVVWVIQQKRPTSSAEPLTKLRRLSTSDRRRLIDFSALPCCKSVYLDLPTPTTMSLVCLRHDRFEIVQRFYYEKNLVEDDAVLPLVASTYEAAIEEFNQDIFEHIFETSVLDYKKFVPVLP